MADRYGWLDGEVAERALRGRPLPSESVAAAHEAEAASHEPRAEAEQAPAQGAFGTAERTAPERLDAFLDELAAQQLHTPQRGPGAELPGEAAAVEGFRAARAGLLRSGAGRRRARRGRWALAGVPLRAGFAVVLAGCALGGVAVAAGTGVLPSPFGGSAPSASSSPMASPGASAGSPDGELPEPGSTDSLDEDGAAPEGSDEKRKRDKEHERSESAHSGSDSAGRSSQSGGASDGRYTHLAKQLCAAYANGALPERKRATLEHAAGGRSAVRAFCSGRGYGWDWPGGPESSQTSSSGGTGSGSGGGGMPSAPATPSTPPEGGSGSSGGSSAPGEGDDGDDDDENSGGSSGGSAGGEETGSSYAPGPGAEGSSSGAAE